MEGMKGFGQTIASFVGRGSRIDLLTYPDGSMGITRNAASVGVWEQAEQEDCVRTFMRMGTAREPIEAVVLVRRRRYDDLLGDAPIHFLLPAPPTEN